MSKEMQQAAIECATKAFEKYNTETEIAAYIKDEFDRKFRPTWHCIVGRDFCSYVCHEAKHFICFYLRQLTILLFKSGARLSFAVPHAVMPPRTREPMRLLSTVIEDADMSFKMQLDAKNCATQAFDKYEKEKDIAAYIKREFDQKFGPTWHCVVGRDFGSYVSPDAKHFTCFSLRRVTILLFRIVKVIDKDLADEYAFRELQMNQKLRELKHPNLVPAYACHETTRKIYIVMKCYADGDLWQYITKKRSLDERETCRIFSGICCGLSVLHARNIIHRDLKPLNILLEQTQRGMNPVLTDFGLARELNPDSVGRSAVGTIRYLPPECQENSKNVRYTKQSDMWSMGAILYECWTGRRAFTKAPCFYADSDRPKTNFPTPSWIQRCLDGLLRRTPSERLTILQLCGEVPAFGIWRGGLKVIGDTSPEGILFDILCCLDLTSLVILQLTDRRLNGAVASNVETLARRS
ncbi:putative dynein light chain [Aphelenchoides avenae]|nr:putative dynein light chain [Aphelenchus avenae]